LTPLRYINEYDMMSGEFYILSNDNVSIAHKVELLNSFT